MNKRAVIVVLQLALAVFAAYAALPLRAAPFEGLSVKWGRPIDLGGGGYARMHRLADGRFMAAYAKDGGVVARFATLKN